MHISVRNFCSLNIVEFEIQKGINIIAGKNGCGKSQLLMALAHQYGNNTISRHLNMDLSKKQVLIDPRPYKALYRPAVRQYGEPASRLFTSLEPPKYIYEPDMTQGYTHNLSMRFNALHNDLSRLFVDFYMPKKDDDSSILCWTVICESFHRVFNKEITGEFRRNQGTRVGLALRNGHISAFHSLSTGELEYLSLLHDIVTETEVDLFLIDEIDAHFHPDLQNKLISEIQGIVGDRYMLLTTHSPSLMLSVAPCNVFYMTKSDDNQSQTNQIIRLVDDIDMLEAVSNLYSGFVGDIKFTKFIADAKNQAIYKYVSECMKPSSIVSGNEAKSYDPQTCFLEGLISSYTEEIAILDYGCGKGRLLCNLKDLVVPSSKRITYVGFDIDDINRAEFEVVAAKYRLNDLFKVPVRHVTSLENVEFDLCIMANVLHEVSPTQITDTFNNLFAHSNEQAKIVILESLELQCGETDYVVFDYDALLEMFSNLIIKNKVVVTGSTPQSFSKNPLMHVTISIIDTSARLVRDDVIRALRVIVRNCSIKLSEHINGQRMNSLKYAFYSFNMAHAEAFIYQLSTS